MSDFDALFQRAKASADSARAAQDERIRNIEHEKEVTLAAWRRPLEEIVRPRLLEAQEALRSKGVFLKVGEVRNDRFRAEENGLRPPHFALEISNISNVQKYEFYSHKDFETPAVIVYCVDDSDRSKSAAAGFPPLVLQVAAEKLSVEQVDKIVELGLRTVLSHSK